MCVVQQEQEACYRVHINKIKHWQKSIRPILTHATRKTVSYSIPESLPVLSYQCQTSIEGSFQVDQTLWNFLFT